MTARALVFLFIAFAFSWAVLGFFYYFDALTSPFVNTAMAVIYMLGPALGAVVTAMLFDKGRLGAVMGVAFRPNLWWLAAWLAPLALVFLALYASYLWPGVTPSSYAEGVKAMGGGQLTEDQAALLARIPLAAFIGIALVAGLIPNTIVALGEELGWRGYLWTVWRPLGFWKMTLLTGLVWGLWHAPLIALGHNYGTDYPGFPWTGIGLMVLATLGFSPIIGVLRERAGSVWPAAIFHGTVNAVVGFAVAMQTGAPRLVRGIEGLSGVAVMAVLGLILFALFRPPRGADPGGNGDTAP